MNCGFCGIEFKPKTWRERYCHPHCRKDGQDLRYLVKKRRRLKGKGRQQ